MERGFKSWAEKKAIELRNELSKKYYEKLQGIELAKYLGIKLIEPNNIPGLSFEDKTLLLNHYHDSWSAVTIKNYLDAFIIIFNPTHSARRQESDLMHELAHIICEHKMEKIIIRTDFPLPLRDYNAEQEDEAKWLGGCLQIPRSALIKMIYKGMDTLELAEHFGASKDMVQYRIKITGASKQFHN